MTHGSAQEFSGSSAPAGQGPAQAVGQGPVPGRVPGQAVGRTGDASSSATVATNAPGRWPLPFYRAVGLELAKMRRLRVVPILLAVTAASTFFAVSTLFSSSMREQWPDPSSDVWLYLLQSLAMLSGALTGPLTAAVLASYVTDIEHTGAGWNLAAGVGLTPGRLLRIKVAALAVLVVPAVLVQSLGVIAIGLAVGVAAPVPVGTWAAWTIAYAVLQLLFIAGHAWLSAVASNQMISMGVGLIGCFIAVYLFLAPEWLARLLPWGYYAVTCPVRMIDAGDLVLTTPSWVSFGILVLVAVTLFVVATARLDRIEEKGVSVGHLGASGRARRHARRSVQPVGDAVRHVAHATERRRRGGVAALTAAELSKLRRSAVPVVTVVVPVLAVISGTVNYLGNQGTLSAGWESLSSQVTIFYSLVFAPLAVAMLVAAAWRVEHRGTSWLMMRSTPHSTTAVVLAKTTAVIVPVAAMQGVLVALTWVAGSTIGLGWRMPVEFLAQGLVFILAVVPLIGLQSLLSMSMRSFAAPVALCLAQVVISFGMVAKANLVALLWPASLVTRALSLGSTAISTSGSLDTTGILPVLAGALGSAVVCWGALALAARRRA